MSCISQLENIRRKLLFALISFTTLYGIFPGNGFGESTPAKLRLVVELGHTDNVTAVSFGPDDRLIITASKDGTARIWNWETGEQLVVLSGHRDAVTSAAIFPNGKRALTTSDDKTIRIWDIATGLETLKLVTTAPVHSAVIAPSGLWFAAIVGDTQTEIDIWDTSGHLQRAIMADFPIECIAVHPDSRSLVAGGYEGHVRSYRVSDGSTIGEYVGQKSLITGVGFLLNGTFLVTKSSTRPGAPKEFTLRLWQVATRKEVHRFEDNSDDVWEIASSPSTASVVGELRGSLRVWDGLSGRGMRDLPMLEGKLALNKSGSLLSVVSDDLNHTIHIVDLRSGRTIKDFAALGKPVKSVAYSSDFMAVGNAFDVTVFSEEMGSARALDGSSAELQGSSIAFDSNGQKLLTNGTDGAYLWDAATRKKIQRVDAGLGIEHVRFSKSGNLFATSSFNSVQIWNSNTFSSKSLSLGTVVSIDDFSFSPDESTLAVAASNDVEALISGVDRGICFWNIARGTRERCVGDDLIGHLVSFSPAGRWLLTVNSDNVTKLREIATGREFPMKVAFEAKTVAFSPDGGTIVVAGIGGAAQLWKTGARDSYATLRGHFSTVTSAGFSPDGKYLLTGSEDGTARLWSLATPHEVCSLIMLGDGHWVVMDPEGRFDADDPGEIKGLHWAFTNDLLKTYPLEQFMALYYEPRLLARILAGERLPTVRAIASLNTRVPSVSIVSITTEQEAGNQVRIRARLSCEEEQNKNGLSREKPCLVDNIRLFRDGSLVAIAKPPSSNLIEKNTGSNNTVEFRHIRISGQNRTVDFSAYDLNADHVKSGTVHKMFDIPEEMRRNPGNGGRVYLITIGIAPQKSGLLYAAEDARVLQQILGEKLQLRVRDRVVQIPLIKGHDDETPLPNLPEILPTKANIRAILDLLAGRDTAQTDLLDIPMSVRSRIQRAGPDDLVMITFSGHGFVDTRGRFYLNPYNEFHPNDEMSEKDRISSDELADWLTNVDSGSFVIILDACFAAALPGKEFKAAPLGNRGIGQLAYDKKMRILAGTQSDNLAKESERLQQGLLTYALVEEGLLQDKANEGHGIYLSNWLGFAEGRVPGLITEFKLQHGGRLQRPYLFDFAKTDLMIEPYVPK